MKKVKSACNKHGHESVHMFQNVNLAKCAAHLQDKCHDSDIAMPKSDGERRKRCIEMMQLESPSSSPHASDAKVDGLVILALTWMLLTY